MASCAISSDPATFTSSTTDSTSRAGTAVKAGSSRSGSAAMSKPDIPEPVKPPSHVVLLGPSRAWPQPPSHHRLWVLLTDRIVHLALKGAPTGNFKLSDGRFPHSQVVDILESLLHRNEDPGQIFKKYKYGKYEHTFDKCLYAVRANLLLLWERAIIDHLATKSLPSIATTAFDKLWNIVTLLSTLPGLDRSTRRFLRNCAADKYWPARNTHRHFPEPLGAILRGVDRSFSWQNMRRSSVGSGDIVGRNSPENKKAEFSSAEAPISSDTANVAHGPLTRSQTTKLAPSSATKTPAERHEKSSMLPEDRDKREQHVPKQLLKQPSATNVEDQKHGAKRDDMKPKGDGIPLAKKASWMPLDLGNHQLPPPKSGSLDFTDLPPPPPPPIPLPCKPPPRRLFTGRIKANGVGLLSSAPKNTSAFTPASQIMIFTQVQALLEKSTFEHLSRVLPKTVAQKGWPSAGLLELPAALREIGGDWPIAHPAEIDKKMWNTVRDMVVEIRNIAVHRRGVTHFRLLELLAAAAKYAEHALGDKKALQRINQMRVMVVSKSEELSDDVVKLDRLSHGRRRLDNGVCGNESELGESKAAENDAEVGEDTRELIDDLQLITSLEISEMVSKMFS